MSVKRRVGVGVEVYLFFLKNAVRVRVRVDTNPNPNPKTAFCGSSCLGKLFCSILNQRLFEYILSLNILHKSQIGFLPNNRTADHVFTLRTLIDKYVHNHNEKIYACFVDFKKAFDSLWHDRLLNELLQIDVGGSFIT